MPRSSPRSSPQTWWSWVQLNLDARGWTKADLARAIRGQAGGEGPDESVIGRWENRGSVPSIDSVRIVAAVFKRDLREALVASGLFTAAELKGRRSWAEPGSADLTTVPDEVLMDELRDRLVRRRGRGGATDSPARIKAPAAQLIDGIESSPDEPDDAPRVNAGRARRTPVTRSSSGSTKREPSGSRRPIGAAEAGGTHHTIPLDLNGKEAPSSSEEDEGASASAEDEAAK